jgi:hypothetical protein
MAKSRLLVPLLEVPAEHLSGAAEDPCSASGRTVAVVSLAGQDGARIALAFSGVEQLTAWYPRARPLPTAGQRVARAAVAEGSTVLLVDSGSAWETQLSGIALVRLANGEPWPQPWQDQLVARGVGGELAQLLAAGWPVRLAEPGAGADLLVTVTVPAGGAGVPGSPLGDRSVQWLGREIAARLAGSALVAAVFEGLIAVRVECAGDRATEVAAVNG